MWHQRDIALRERPRGFHLITGEVVDHLPELDGLKAGLLHLLLQHTSASLTLNESPPAPRARRAAGPAVDPVDVVTSGRDV